MPFYQLVAVLLITHPIPLPVLSSALSLYLPQIVFPWKHLPNPAALRVRVEGYILLGLPKDWVCGLGQGPTSQLPLENLPPVQGFLVSVLLTFRAG